MIERRNGVVSNCFAANPQSELFHTLERPLLCRDYQSLIPRSDGKKALMTWVGNSITTTFCNLETLCLSPGYVLEQLFINSLCFSCFTYRIPLVFLVKPEQTNLILKQQHGQLFFSLFIHLAFIQMSFLLEAKLKQCAVWCVPSAQFQREQDRLRCLTVCLVSLGGLFSAALCYNYTNVNMSCNNK